MPARRGKDSEVRIPTDCGPLCHRWLLLFARDTMSAQHADLILDCFEFVVFYGMQTIHQNLA